MRMRTLRSRVTAILVATALPLAGTLWMAATLLERCLTYSSTSLHALTDEALSGRAQIGFVSQKDFDPELEDFGSSKDPERFLRTGDHGQTQHLLERRPRDKALV